MGRPRRLRSVAFALANVVATGGTFCAIVILGQRRRWHDGRPSCLYDLRGATDALLTWCRRPSRVRVLGGGFREAWTRSAEFVAPGWLGDVLQFHEESHGAAVLQAKKR